MLMQKFKIVGLILLFSLSIPTSAQIEKKYYFENISIQDGLSNTRVLDMVQDKYGFLWIATLDGLNRYDGYNIKIFKNDPEDNNTLPNNHVQTLFIDKQDNLLVGSQSGLSIYDRTSETFTTLLPVSNDLTSQANNTNNPNRVLKIFEDSKGRIWVGAGTGIYLFNLKEKKFRLTFIKNEDKKVPTLGGGWYGLSMLETSSHEIYSESYDFGLIKYNESSKLFEKIEFDQINQKYLIGNSIINVFEDKTGKLWLCTSNGLFTYDPHSTSFEKMKLFESEVVENSNYMVTDIYPDENGFLWITTANKGIIRFNLRNNNVVQLDQSSFPEGVNFKDPFFKSYMDNFGILWILTWDKGLLKLDFQKEPFRLYAKPGGNNSSNNNLRILSLLQDKNNNDIIWLGSNNGFYKYYLSDKSFEKFENIKGNSKSLPSNSILSIVNGDASGLWLGTANGLSYYNTLENSFTNYDLTESTDFYSISYNDIRHISKDGYGNLWLATDNGLVKFDTKTKSKSFIREELRNTYNNSLLAYIDSLHIKKKYFSSILKVGDYQNLEEEFEINERTDVLVVSVGEGIGGMWDYGWLTNGENDTLFIHKNSTNVFNYFSGNGKNRIYAKVISLEKGKHQLRYTSDDSHSYGKWNTVPPIDSTWWGVQVFKLPENDKGKISEWIAESENQQILQGTSTLVTKYQKDGTIIIGTNEGFSKYFISQNRIENYKYPSEIPNTTNTKQINDILIEDDGDIWLATMGGLINYNQNTKEYSFLYDKDGFASNYLQAIQEDSYGNLWISTLNGITKFNKDIKTPIFINYDVQDGLQSYTFAPRASYKSDSGELFFAGINGFNSFHSGNINKQLPKINISEIKINNKIVLPNSENSPLTKSVLDTKDIILNYGQNSISFDFNSIHFSRPDKNMNAYMLEGFDKDGWIYTDRKFATYTNLPEGKYIFKVKGSNGDGIWNEEGTLINIKILPPWWRTIWAYIGYGLVFVGIVFGIDRLQRRRLLKRARETARIREAEIRAQLAEAQSERKSKELEEARQLQLSMLPKELPQLPHLDIAVYMKTATEVGGDYYDFHIGIDGALTVVVGDATGHGMKAGTMVTTTKSLFNVLAPNPNIVETFHEMTRCLKLMQMEKLSMCMTMIKIMGNKIQMSAAGMPPVFISKKESQSIEEHVMKGMPLGTFNNFPYSLIESNISSGDTILMMSDGFPELMNDSKEMFGYKQARNLFEEISGESPEDIITKLKNAGSEWTNDADPDDDVTFVVIKVK